MRFFQMNILQWIFTLTSFFTNNRNNISTSKSETTFVSNDTVKTISKVNNKSLSYTHFKDRDLIKKNTDEEHYIKQLNNQNVYLLVTDLFSETSKNLKKNDTSKENLKLLLIHTQDRLSNTFALKESRFNKIFLRGKQEGFLGKSKYRNENGFRIERMVFNKFREPKDTYFKRKGRPGKSRDIVGNQPFNIYFKNPKVYYPENKGGYKSICPVFLNKKDAEFFLLNIYQPHLKLLSSLPPISQPEIFNGLCKTKIIQVGLGDFIQFYTNEEPNSLKLVDFLFFPDKKSLEKGSRFNPFKLLFFGKPIKQDSFYSYQKRLLSHKEKLKTDDYSEYNVNLASNLENSQSYLEYFYSKYKEEFLSLERRNYKQVGGSLKEFNKLLNTKTAQSLPSSAQLIETNSFPFESFKGF